ncbi:MAG: lipid-A-disaccharide synthase N-terminal domain-containing protein [Neomegalonema sp.]|nr:lipid-A-disaccharide synthase N-terminal domain-containing protein [Neomegalonema sp.]
MSDAFFVATSAAAAATDAAAPNWLMRALLVDSWMGVALALYGLLAQAVFMSRMMVQWIASERAKRSVVPVAFWWLSLSGAAMLLVYGVLRQDIVIIIAQAFGFFVYMRNLSLIAREKKDTEA